VEDLQCYSDCGFNCSISRSAFLKCGGFDRLMRPKFEDLELGQRLHSFGVETVFEPRAILTHYESKNLVDDVQVYWRHGLRLAFYRLNIKRQRNPQLSALRRLKSRNPARRIFQFVSWTTPVINRNCAKFSRALCDKTGSSWFMHQWQRLQAATEGIQALKSEGINLAQVRELVGEPTLVLALRCISPKLSKADGEFHISSQKFRRLLKMLADLEYESVTSRQFTGAKAGRNCLLTFDEGFEDLYSELLPLIGPHGLKPLVFVVADRIGRFNTWESTAGYTKRSLLSATQIREMAKYGVEFGSQTCTHSWLPSLTEKDLRREVNDSKGKLEDLLGAEITSFAYPYGGANAHIRATVARAGYTRAFSSSPGLSFWDDPMWIRRVEVAEQDSSFSMSLKLRTGKNLSQRVAERITHLRNLLTSRTADC
jgi:peptidoglycan/xylan/chitin deacetylase (PgdA/CDA1 family)